MREDVPYIVVINEEEQYSIWPEWRQIPAGWRAVGKSGTKDECVAYIDEVWTDMRPLSLRRAMEADEQEAAASNGAPDG
jgi:MbtH protein